MCETGIVFFNYWNKTGRMVFRVFGDAIYEFDLMVLNEAYVTRMCLQMARRKWTGARHSMHLYIKTNVASSSLDQVCLAK